MRMARALHPLGISIAWSTAARERTLVKHGSLPDQTHLLPARYGFGISPRVVAGTAETDRQGRAPEQREPTALIRAGRTGIVSRQSLKRGRTRRDCGD
ncbi:hypothetical protein NITHO_2110003 [Nitrolancea hollandica Lb]|uniref:Uncharacterized protein n=1 Tax=Nitrolancea hollandica Lb TaxID=1129897 RepID=I4EEZ3_9BACT|nr:hypothetical protein NITHO_2110003 [Nitrolancea hollandica Lb]